jgi:hypothetical protein
LAADKLELGEVDAELLADSVRVEVEDKLELPVTEAVLLALKVCEDVRLAESEILPLVL